METAYTLAHGDHELLSHYLLRRVLGQLEIVDARHDTRKVVVCGQWGFVRLADDGERRVEALEA